MKKKILIVEDEEEIRFLIKEILSQPYLELIFAEDAFTGLKLLRKLKPDLVLLDVNLPYMDGVEFTKITREYEGTKDVPIIVITGRRDMDTVIKMKKLHINGYLLKPFLPDVLIREVSNILGIKISLED
jgi:DNA-binding response OmpR family regulator